MKTLSVLPHGKYLGTSYMGSKIHLLFYVGWVDASGAGGSTLTLAIVYGIAQVILTITLYKQ